MGFDSLFLTRFGPRRQVSGHGFSRALQFLKETLPRAAGSRAAAPGRPGFGLLGRNAAERAKKRFEKQSTYSPPFAPQRNVIPFVPWGAERLHDGTALPAVRSRTVANESEQPRVKPKADSV